MRMMQKLNFCPKINSCIYNYECGLMINNEFSFLGASPNVIICDNGQSGIVEVKCPYCPRHLTIPEASEKIKDFPLQKVDNNL